MTGTCSGSAYMACVVFGVLFTVWAVRYFWGVRT